MRLSIIGGFMAAGVIAYVEWVSILSPANEFMTAHPHPSLTALLIESGHWHNSIYDVPGEGLALVATFVIVCILLMLGIFRLGQYGTHRMYGLSVIDLKISLNFDQPDMARSTLTRIQRYHANTKAISAYVYEYSIDSDSGEIVPGEFDLKSYIDERLITADLLETVTRTKLNLIELFEEPLRTPRLLQFLPTWGKMLLVNNGFFQESVVVRKGRVSNLHEYDGPSPRYSIVAARKPVYNISFEVKFFEATAPQEKSVRAFVISENAAKINRVTVVNGDDGTVTYSTKVRRLYRASLQLRWSNEKLHALHPRSTRSAAVGRMPTLSSALS